MQSIVCVDVDYQETGAGVVTATAAALWCPDWNSPAPLVQAVVRVGNVAPYRPGAFYERELPCILAVLGAPPAEARSMIFRTIVIDGYAWLGSGMPGLGAHLRHELGGAAAVVGVAKTKYLGAPAVEVLRGASAKPLYVTADGMNPAVAADMVRGMHGPHRLPTLLKGVDSLCRRPGPALTS